MERSSGAPWLKNATESLDANRGRAIFNREAPQALINGAFWPELAMQSGLLGHWVTDQRFDEPAQKFYLFDDAGALRPAKILATAVTLPGPVPGCGYLVEDRPVALDIPGPGFDWKWMLQVNDLAERDGEIELDFGSKSVVVPVERGLGDSPWRSTSDPLSRSRPGVYPGLSVCVDRVQWGNPGVAVQ